MFLLLYLFIIIKNIIINKTKLPCAFPYSVCFVVFYVCFVYVLCFSCFISLAAENKSKQTKTKQTNTQTRKQKRSKQESYRENESKANKRTTNKTKTNQTKKIYRQIKQKTKKTTNKVSGPALLGSQLPLPSPCQGKYKE